MLSHKKLHMFYKHMVTNMSGLQVKNNVNVINQFSKRYIRLVNFGHTADVPVLRKWT